ncbi:MAG: type VI secretion system protein TssA [Planctomycetota bacterium]|nr:type VI secretion system protein TssA [Planctomycetota bacterium]
MATDALLDFDQLLAPISDDEPCGGSLRYDPVYDQISTLRKQQSSAVDESADTVADWPKVRDLSTDTLETKAKDLQIAAWLLEALVELHGFAGMRDGFRLFHALIDTFWDNLHPEIDDDGDLGARAAPINSLAAGDGGARMPARIREIPLAHSDGGEIFTYSYRQSAIAGPQGEDESESDYSRRQRDAESKRETFETAVNGTPAKFYADLNEDLAGCREQLKELESVVDEKLGDDAPGWSGLRQAIEDVERTLRPILTAKGVIGTDEEEDADSDDSHDDSDDDNQGGSGGGGGPVRTRADAIRKLQEVVDFLRRTEPHSPVAYLVQRAIKWAHQPLESVLGELVKDSSVLESIEDVLGIQSSSNDDD